ncbi:MAG: hypothetical protein ABI778_10400, partial [Ignavibacteriota bacterium]
GRKFRIFACWGSVGMGGVGSETKRMTENARNKDYSFLYEESAECRLFCVMGDCVMCTQMLLNYNDFQGLNGTFDALN